MELWDAYNEKCNKIPGMTLEREKVHEIPDGVFHMVVSVILKHEDGTYLLMQRDPNKHYPLKWDLTAGGSVLKDEKPLDGAKRELKEETGIEGKDFVQLGIMISPKTHSIYINYIATTDCKKDAVKLQKGETVAYKWLSKNELKDEDKLDLAVNRTYRALIQTSAFAL